MTYICIWGIVVDVASPAAITERIRGGVLSSYFTGVLIVTLLTMAGIELVVLSNPTLPAGKKKRFSLGYALVAVAACCEWLAVYLQNTSVPLFVRMFVKCMELVLAPTIPLAVIPTVSESRLLKRIMLVVVFVNFLLIGLSAWLGFVFYFDSALHYQHGKLYFLYILVYMTESLCLICVLIRFFQTYQYKNIFPQAVFIIVFLFCGLLLQFIDSSVKVDFLSVSILLLFLYILHERTVSCSDSLTKVLNRQTYDNRISHLDKVTTIINVDIDGFKQCNDFFGHLFGDEVLKIVAGTLQSCFISDGLCYRTGGDEFCVICNGELRDPDAALSRLHAMIDSRRSVTPHLPFISTGYAIHDPKKEITQTAIKRADEMMYRFKNMRKSLLRDGLPSGYHEIQKHLKELQA